MSKTVNNIVLSIEDREIALTEFLIVLKNDNQPHYKVSIKVRSSDFFYHWANNMELEKDFTVQFLGADDEIVKEIKLNKNRMVAFKELNNPNELHIIQELEFYASNVIFYHY